MPPGPPKCPRVVILGPPKCPRVLTPVAGSSFLLINIIQGNLVALLYLQNAGVSGGRNTRFPHFLVQDSSGSRQFRCQAMWGILAHSPSKWHFGISTPNPLQSDSEWNGLVGGILGLGPGGIGSLAVVKF